MKEKTLTPTPIITSLYTVENFHTMYSRYQTIVHQQIYKLGIYRDTDDYFQEGMCAIVQALPTIDANHPNKLGYLSQHVRRRLIDKLRQQQHQTAQIFFTDDDTTLERGECCEYECDLLDQFDPQDQTIVHFVLKGYSNKEIAKIMGVNPRTILRRLQAYQDRYPRNMRESK